MESSKDKVRVTVALPKNLIEIIDSLAARDFQTRSQWIYQALVRLVKEEQLREEKE